MKNYFGKILTELLVLITLEGTKLYSSGRSQLEFLLEFDICCGILLTPLRWFKQIKRTVSFDVTTRFNPIQQSTAMYNSHILNVRNTAINVTKRSTINSTKTKTF